MCRAIVRTAVVAGRPHYHVRLSVERCGEWSVCGVLVFHSTEWAAFLRIAAAERIEVIHETVPADPATTRAAK